MVRTWYSSDLVSSTRATPMATRGPVLRKALHRRFCFGIFCVSSWLPETSAEAPAPALWTLIVTLLPYTPNNVSKYTKYCTKIHQILNQNTMVWSWIHVVVPHAGSTFKISRFPSVFRSKIQRVSMQNDDVAVLTSARCGGDVGNTIMGDRQKNKRISIFP